MGFFKKKSKLDRIVPRTSRTKDNRPFFIPEIRTIEDKKNMTNTFISPFGVENKQVVSIPNDRTGTGDIDKKYDIFRKQKRLTKEEAQKRFGSSYYEFVSIDNNVHKKAFSEEGLTADDLTRRKPTEPDVLPEDIIDEHRSIETVPVDEFFAKVTSQETKKNKENDEVLNDLVDNFEQDSMEKEVSFEEETVEDIIFKKDEIIEEEPEIGFADDLIYQEYKPKTKEHKPHIESENVDLKAYALPPITLFKKNETKTDVEPSWVKENIDVINETMLSFGIDGTVTNYTMGPTVTRYEVSLASGVPTKKITSISDNIQMSLSAFSIRIEAPIPGKNTVGIEVPNRIRESVYFGDVVDNPKFLKSKDPLLLAIGLDIDALPVYTSIESMPHGLVAGSTQSGKSVCIASIIVSLITRNKPDEVKLMLIDPKKVDLQQFADLPHLITPIIDETQVANEALKWMVKEMEERYDILKRFKAVNVVDYYTRRSDLPNFVKMPRIVVIIEEASDLLLSGGSEIEESILKLTQKSRAVGIHLLLATQRPSADILKGAIKANIPTRFAFRVPSSTDSSVVLDMTGAEKLLGKGDMLFSENGMARRLQGAYLSPEEIESITDYIKEQREPEYMFTRESLVIQMASGESFDQIDELFKDVATYVVEEGKCSLNKITQVFGIGFNRATQIVNTLEKFGIVSENVGTKPRTVLVEYSGLSQIFEELDE
ncbi:MAG: DNA translocase FtsK [Candidatus Izemoplasmatales bacterium]|nr:DNA translocase FtsK [Candidatus Izemoplasmatales bacterium]